MRKMTNRTKLIWFAIILICVRLAFAISFCSSITDADQLLFSLMATDIQHGIFNAFFIYGQAYNFPFESWLALPLLLGQIPWNIALPVAAGVLGIFPYFILAFIFYRKSNIPAAYLALCLPLILCPEFHYITTIPRGFTGALALFFFRIIFTRL